MIGNRFLSFTAATLLVAGSVFAIPGLAGGAVLKGVVTHNERPLADAEVSVKGVSLEDLKIEAPGASRVAIEQKRLEFSPYVTAVMVGTTVDFPNDDDTWHNVFSTSDAKTFDLGLYPPGESRSVTFDRPGIVRILCNVHPTMKAYVVVEEHPLFSVTGPDGNYRIDGVPPGHYRLEAWHPESGRTTASITIVGEEEVSNVALEIDE